jgi:hypothetical protein
MNNNTCTPGQDQPTDCCHSTAGQYLCPAVAETAPATP